MITFVDELKRDGISMIKKKKKKERSGLLLFNRRKEKGRGKKWIALSIDFSNRGEHNYSVLR